MVRQFALVLPSTSRLAHPSDPLLGSPCLSPPALCSQLEDHLDALILLHNLNAHPKQQPSSFCYTSMMLLPLFAKHVDPRRRLHMGSDRYSFTSPLQFARCHSLRSLFVASFWHPARCPLAPKQRTPPSRREVPHRRGRDTPKGISLQRSWPEAEAAPNDRLASLRALVFLVQDSSLREGPVPAGARPVLAGPR